ncbi:carbon-monoxide dehydrogenase large subunit [Tistlia consotensis]|uniref:Carbon-monoxide dehydrogenase large subunit n=1 Tax=Tistlia consotensis USBA 355 TaxID=560819 RepID=A0A1Y6B938_9PROT|nr:xanthine dehydrogenase family protein molybdopterin-binding subunit [Tistlia consotensis]SME88187.1 carbon-monoxide dehydrogenase large subunit [Tistlia consotensis USBA 355]SNR24615.1 carbon-monoxide dehydrogenase large subunit [Tistlia consotensis]
MTFEDERLLRSRGRYLDDRAPAGCLQMAILRAPLAHAAITGLDVAAARAAPGVRLVLTGEDLARLGIGPLTCRGAIESSDGTPMIEPERPVLARGAVKHVGQPVAAVIAETLEAALDALEAIELELDERPVVVDPEAAAAPDAPPVWEQAPGNRAFDWQIGNRAETEAAFAGAAHRVALTVRHPRIAIAPIETRGALATFDADADAAGGRWTLWTPSQGVVSLRSAMAACLGVATGRVRVITEDVGGSFAVKIWPYPEQVLALVAARETGRPVKWVASRMEAMLADAMGRGRVDRAELALDAEGRFLGFRIDALADMGAFLNTAAPGIVTKGAVRVFGHCYRIPGLHYRVQGLFTNAVPTDAYRGAAKPETVSTLERLIDVAAARLGLDRVELRRRNLVRPADLPYPTAMGETYDGGDFPAMLERVLLAADWGGFEGRRAGSRARGRLRGAGLGLHLHATGGSTAERSEVRALPDGTVRVRSGSQDSGQGHRRALAVVAADTLGIPVERIRVEQGDSDWLEIGGGTGGSNLLAVAGNTVHRAALQMVDRMKASAGLLLEAAAPDIEYGAGSFRIVGTDRALSLAEVAAGWEALDAAQRESEPEAGCLGQLDFAGIHTTFPNGAYVAEVEVDPETGQVRLDRFTGVDDLGRVFDEASAQGQVQGGIAQEAGEVLTESLRYDPESGQLLSGSLLDYALPRADDLPAFDLAFAPTPSPNSLIGAKGVGELPSIGAPGPILNAVLHALSERGIEHLDPPLTPEKVWRALQGTEG